jgi:thymidylate synthase
MRQYLDLLQTILDDGEWSENRTGVRTKSVWGYQMRFDLADGFPLVTTKKTHMPSITTELLFFLQGYTDVRWLQERKCRIWNEWSTKEHCKARGLEEFDLGPVYGWQWRHSGAEYRGMKSDRPDSISYEGEGVDQLLWAQNQIRTNPDSRQIILNAWNAKDKPQQALPPCHVLMHFRVYGDRLSGHLFQRSCDSFLGVPFNIASYALFLQMMAQTCGLKPGEFIHTLSDAHIYENHMPQVEEQLSREPRPLPGLKLNPTIREITGFDTDDIQITGYDPHPAIKGKVAV